MLHMNIFFRTLSEHGILSNLSKATQEACGKTKKNWALKNYVNIFLIYLFILKHWLRTERQKSQTFVNYHTVSLWESDTWGAQNGGTCTIKKQQQHNFHHLKYWANSVFSFNYFSMWNYKSLVFRSWVLNQFKKKNNKNRHGKICHKKAWELTQVDQKACLKLFLCYAFSTGWEKAGLNLGVPYWDLHCSLH